MDNINVKSIILFILSVSIVLHVAGYTAVDYNPSNAGFLDTFVDLGDGANSQTIGMSSNLTATLDDITNPSG